jgi:glycolate oxidase iron-sulfur subunit
MLTNTNGHMSGDFLRDADLCVKCGLCLPYCPTYQKTRDENESPRGRLALMQGWAGGNLPATGKLDAHISNCLLCRSCEKVCPAQVPYGRLVDEFRVQTASIRKDSIVLSLVKAVVHNPSLRSRLQSLLTLYQRSGLNGFLQRINLAGALPIKKTPARLIAGLPEMSTPFPKNVAPSINHKGLVGLFSGCLGDLLEPETLIAAQRLLTLAGYEVHRPAGQTCCGALDLHSGDRQRAEQCGRQNCTAFKADNLTAIVTVASGCGAMLQESVAGFAGKVVDISSFLLNNQALANLRFLPLSARIIVHTPCSLANVMHDDSSALQLLQHLPQAELLPLPSTLKCCGSAGAYMLDHPAMAQALLEDFLMVIRRYRPHYVATSNIGCALHLRAGLKVLKAEIEVLHPVALLNRRLNIPGQ